MCRPGPAIPSFSTSTATAIFSPASSAASATSSPTAPGSSRCPIAAMPDRAGSRASSGLLQDAAAAYAFTTARYGADSIVVWGFSLGTGVAVALAAEQPVGRLILEAPYTSTADVAASAFRFVPVRLLMRDQFRSDRAHRAGHGSAADHAWRAAIRRFPLPLASGCLRWRTSRSGLSALPGAVMTIWTISARSKPRDNFINLAKG